MLRTIALFALVCLAAGRHVYKSDTAVPMTPFYVTDDADIEPQHVRTLAIMEAKHNHTHQNVTINRQVSWLLRLMNNNMPKSYIDTLPKTGTSFWATYNYLRDGPVDPFGQTVEFDSIIASQERALTHVGLNIYDGACWTIALALNGLSSVVEMYHRNVLYQSTTGANPTVDGLMNIRGNDERYLYGANAIPGDQLDLVTLPDNSSQPFLEDPFCCGSCCEIDLRKEIPGGFFYRMIGPSYRMQDPLMGGYGWTWKYPYPHPDPTTPWNQPGIIHWNDWKPITGENVWAGMLGPMQVLWLKNCGEIEEFEDFEDAPAEMQFALSMMPGLVALEAPLGSVYHGPDGMDMFPPDPREAINVSNENNFSAYAAMVFTKYVLDTFANATADPILVQAKVDLARMIEGMDHWFDNYLVGTLEDVDVVLQGGHITWEGVYDPENGTQAFAVDCQTWGMTVTGAKRFDDHYGGEGRAHEVWQATKEIAGHYVNGELAGVGYTTGRVDRDIWSGEWTFGAINMAKKLGREYRELGREDLAQSFLADAESMTRLMAVPAETDEDGAWIPGGGLLLDDGSYLYANKRFFIPWGWHANPIGATSSTAWAVMINDYNYNPFELGGGADSTFLEQKCPSSSVKSPPDMSKYKPY